MLKNRVERENISNVSLKGPVEKSYVPYILSKADVNLWNFSASPLLKYGASPNKLFDYLASGKPILATGKVAKSPVAAYQCGFETEDNSPSQICGGVMRLYRTPKEVREGMGRNARQARRRMIFKN